MSNSLTAIIFGLIAGGATISGIYLVVWKIEWTKKHLISLISFAAGLLLSFAFIHLIPESLNLMPSALIFVLASFLAFYFLEHNIYYHSCPDGNCEEHPFGLVALISVLLHSLMDGIVIGAGFGVSYGLGILATISVIFHEIPEGITSVSILLHAGYPRKKAIFLSWLVALATPFGVLLTVLFFSSFTESIIGILLAIAAGSFIYVAASDLIPEIHKKTRHANAFMIFIGVLIPILLGVLFE